MEITKMLTIYNHNKSTADRIKYIVLHYVGATGSAKQNCDYYASGQVGSSAHYFVDFDGSIYQSVEDANIAWHCGAKSYVHPECRNSNSIGIEMCVRNKGDKAADSTDWYFEDATIKGAIALTKMLMAKYNVDIDHILRHHDVTGKICPNPMVLKPQMWLDFKSALTKSKWEYDGKWEQSGLEWNYRLDSGELLKADWLKWKNNYYFLDDSGILVRGLRTIENQKYYFNEEKNDKQGALCKTDAGGALVIWDL